MQSKMVLTICGQQEVEDPSDSDIQRALSDLDVSTGEAFAVLGTDDMTYIQAGGDKNARFDLEYQKGSTDRHYRAKRSSIPLEEIVAAFVGYRDRDDRWMEGFEFERITW